MLSMLDQLIMREAITSAIEEVKVTPIAIGQSVGHTDFDAYGNRSGILTAYEGTEAVVTQKISGEIFRLPIEGMVDIDRVYDLAEQYASRLETMLGVIEVMNTLGIPPQQTINALLNMPKGPTPGCDCPHCMKYTQEERDAALTTNTNQGTPLSDGETVVAEGIGGDTQIEKLLEKLKSTTSFQNGNGSGYVN